MSEGLHAILEKHRHEPTQLVQILRDVMRSDGTLGAKTLTVIAQDLGLPRARVEGVAGFYSFFTTDEDVGRFRVLFSDNITDEMQGSHALRRRMLDAFDVELGGTSRDGLVTIGATSCTGLCDQGPAMLVNGRAIGRLDLARIGAIASLLRSETPVEEWPANLFEIETHVERKDLLLATPLAPGEAITAAIAAGRDATLEQIRASKLRGRGGAGYPTATKWEACKNATGAQRTVVCNADEGEPGTFKDRVLLSDWADLVFEGMTVAAWVVGASRGFVYLRGEYEFLGPHLHKVLDARRRAGLLGYNVAGARGFEFDIEIAWGAGAYVCGEETALLESLEGKRGIPRNRPPYPVTHGYLGTPTSVNNVETLAAAAHIALRGGSWFTARGTPKSAGTKVHSVSGDVARPGIYELPFGVTVQELLDLAGAKDAQAVQVGGPSGALLSRAEFGRRVAFEDVPSAGAFMVFDETRDIVEVVDNFARFFAHESCGFCTPCRVGTTLMAQMTHRLATGKGTRRDIKDLARVAGVMRGASHCGLGATAGNPVVAGLDKFRPAFNRRLASLEVMPSFDLDEALAPAREATGREDARAHIPSVKP